MLVCRNVQWWPSSWFFLQVQDVLSTVESLTALLSLEAKLTWAASPDKPVIVADAFRSIVREGEILHHTGAYVTLQFMCGVVWSIVLTVVGFTPPSFGAASRLRSTCGCSRTCG